MRIVPPLLAAATVAGLGLWFLRPAPEPERRVDPAEAVAAFVTEAGAVPVMTLEVTAEPMRDRLAVRGRTVANRRVEVEAETEGRVISEPLRRGAQVSEGQLLCRLDPGSRPAQLAEARAALAEAETEARAAESLSGKGFVSETTRFAREAALQAAQAKVDLVELDIERLEIRAPFGGMLESDTAELGARLGVGEVCATVIDLSVVRASGFVSEQVIDRLAEGQEATVRLVTGLETEGTLSFLSRVADPDTRTYEVEATVPNPEGRIRDGMTAEITVTLPAREAHRIPQSALTLDDDGRLGVRLAEDGHARFAPVTILRDETDGIWVTGLPPLARVIVVGHEFVRDGRAIRAEPVGWGDLG